ncbi:hypothetical protein AX14_011099, partial [Amanita brunnescens Koide BX004]
RATEPVWPEWTDLVIGKSLKLTEQVFELQLVIRRTMELVEERFIFEDSFPGLITRNGWNQCAIKQACQEISGPSPPTVKAKYQMISDRSDADRGYLKEISSLSYGIFANNVANRLLVNDLLFKFNYIYIQKGHDYDKSKPYEHPVVVDVLRAIFFSMSSPITAQYPERFKLDNKETLK